MVAPTRTSRPALARRRAVLWGRAAACAFVVLLIASVTGYYFGTVHEEIFDISTGHFLDCGTIFAANDLPVAVANCHGASSGDLIGFILMATLIVVSLAVTVYGSIREYRGSGRR